ncbi:hypothetical protein CYMTET_35856 [Cymbomonas tetramitiformis]|uniref:Glycoside hydrolase family 3 N-terminal domain-containing protein n=1 Tax=Cymbomonas tetramitiformis TaxID=36881 RepID=A0AAE0F8C6_9CHLO|nr:hypothetical protein CYMTET_35856 [Cymbomonas tetramitiformis]
MIERGVGGIVLFGRNVENPEQVKKLCNALKKKAKNRPLLICVDQEGGRVARIGPPLSSIPPARELSKSQDAMAAASTAGQVLGRELRELNIDMNFAPVMDVDTNPANPVIGDRSFSHDPSVVSEMGSHFIHALQGKGVAACAKHFPGHGDTHLDSHLSLPTVHHSMERLEQIELEPFAAAITADVAAVMVAHIVAPAFGGEPVPASIDKEVIGYLRHTMGFQGVIATDDMEMGCSFAEMTVGWPRTVFFR